MRDTPFDDDRAVPEGEPEVVKGIELKGKTGFDLRAAAADLLIPIGWKTMTSPRSSPRISIRSVSRLSSAVIQRDYNTLPPSRAEVD